jgi:hypothetical protein
LWKGTALAIFLPHQLHHHPQWPAAQGRKIMSKRRIQRNNSQ